MKSFIVIKKKKGMIDIKIQNEGRRMHESALAEHAIVNN